METTATYGTGLEYADGLRAAATTWTEINKVDKVTPPKLKIANHEQKPLKAPNQAILKKANWKSADDASVSVFYDKSQMAALYALAGTSRGWRVTLADGSKVEFDGFISDYGNPELNGDGDVMIDFAITTSGLPEFTAAA